MFNLEYICNLLLRNVGHKAATKKNKNYIFT